MADSENEYNDGASSLGEASMSLSDVSMGEAPMEFSSHENAPDDDSNSANHPSEPARLLASLKRPLPESEKQEDHHPLKRRPGIYSHAYVHTLNAAVLEAASRNVPSNPEETPLHDTQLGLTYWTAEEKHRFFSLIARLGKDNLPAIARELRTKGELEIRQYAVILDDAVQFRQNLARYEQGNIKKPDILTPIQLANIPAAAEISEEGERLLEGAADALAVRQEKVEDADEKHKWGGRWRVTQALAKDLGQLADRRLASDLPLKVGREKKTTDEKTDSRGSTVAPEDQKVAQITDLFALPTWLRLSERIFMNGGMESDNNWRLVGTEKPSIRMTALEDFYTITNSITRKLVAASLAMAEQRIRLRLNAVSNLKPRVRKRDVRAAVASTRMKRNPQKFWRDVPRRLQLDVHEIEPKATDQMEPMEYDDIEDTLVVDYDSEVEPDVHFDNDYELSEDEDFHQIDSGTCGLEITGFPTDEPVLSCGEDAGVVDNDDDNSDGIIDVVEEEDEDELKIQKEIKEIMTYTAVDYPETHVPQEALRHRIISERQRERQAEAVDIKNSRLEEVRLWELLNQKPPLELAGPPAANEGKVEDGKTHVKVEELFNWMAADWRDSTNYESEWEEEIPRALGVKK
ncbi:RNA polymerase I-specific transcription initiation factor rrn5 [Zalerion maritima]|uniref:RNA polymerase I-specific transcription initiation factor rrn5 n=1 Tax=Zalerion maritima TaxID=339359 RepID=A0AAD5RGC0_9PEZI|nr:RNA polymerase I-specific transcription initiation factor rrn5 [Zalerion maritima]